MKHKKTAFALLLTVVLLLQMLCTAVYADGLRRDTSLKLTVDVGFNGFYKIGSTVPVFIEVENSSRDIKGELQMELPDDSGNITIYALEVNLPKDTTKQYVMNVPIFTFMSKLNVSVVEGRKKLITKVVRPSSPASSDNMIIGLLSDDDESISYIDKIPLKNYSHIKTHRISINEKTLPRNAEALGMLNAIVINNYDTSRLDKEQYTALKKWVEEGGVLLLGTGATYSKTLSVFKDDFLVGKTGELQSISTTALYKLMDKVSADAPMSLKVLQLELEGAVKLLEDSELALVQRINKKRGVVAVAAFDLGMEPITEWVGSKAFSESLMGSILPEYYTGMYFEKKMMMSDNLYPIDNSLRSVPELPQPSPMALFLIFAVYIIAVGPISYLVLKRLDRRELMWIAVPVISIVFSAVVYFTGYGTRLTEPLANVISIIEIEPSGVMLPKTYAGIFTPNKSNLRVEASESFKLKPLITNMRHSYGGDNQASKVVSKVVLAPKPAIEYYNTGVWSMRNIMLDSGEAKTGSFTAELNYVSNRLTGSITNNTGLDLYECYIVTDSQFVKVGAIADGESIKLDEEIKDYYGNRYDLFNAIYNDPYNYNIRSSKKTKAEVQVYRENMQKRQILEYYFWGGTEGGAGAKIIGWSRTSVAGDLLVNGAKVRKIEKSFVAANTSISYRQGDTISYPMGAIKPTIMSSLTQGHYDEMGKGFYGSGTIELMFKLDQSIAVAEIALEAVTANTDIQKLIYNNSTSNWEDFSSDKLTIEGEDIKKYLSLENGLMLRFELTDDNMPLPRIAVKGSVK